MQGFLYLTLEVNSALVNRHSNSHFSFQKRWKHYLLNCCPITDSIGKHLQFAERFADAKSTIRHLIKELFLDLGVKVWSDILTGIDTLESTNLFQKDMKTYFLGQ